jgi:hypothetical protein
VPNLHIDIDCGTGWNVVFETPVIRGAFLRAPDFVYPMSPGTVVAFLVGSNGVMIGDLTSLVDQHEH